MRENKGNECTIHIYAIPGGDPRGDMTVVECKDLAMRVRETNEKEGLLYILST